ncbi:MAG: GNAT family N-acetyltransferase [Alphaproteobacteria bacterium]
MELDLTTERLLLRPVTLADIDLAIEMFTDLDVVKYNGNVLMTLDAIADEMPTWVKRGGGGCIGIWCVTDRATGKILETRSCCRNRLTRMTPTGTWSYLTSCRPVM